MLIFFFWGKKCYVMLFFSLQFILLHLLQGFTNFCLRWYSINKIAKIMIMIVTVVCMCYSFINGKNINFYQDKDKKQ